MTKKKINIVYILDSSGSMAGGKYDEGKSGFIKEIKELSKNEEIEYTFTLVEFSTGVVTHFFKDSNYDNILAQTKLIQNQQGWTSLNDAVGQTLIRLISENIKGEGTIVSIITDGEENWSKTYTFDQIKFLIPIAEKCGMTITFIGTKFDTQSAINNYGIKSSNTYVHDNTPEGFRKMSKSRTDSTSFYSQSLSRGADLESLQTNFFSSEDNG